MSQAPDNPAPPTPRDQSRAKLRLTVALHSILAAAETESAPPLTLGLIIDTTGERAFGLLMAFLCLPFVQPIPLPGLSIPFGIAVMILGAQITLRKHRPWLPRRMLKLHLPKRISTKLIAFIAKIFRPLERIVRPRLLFMQNNAAMAVVGIALFIDGFLLVFLPAFPGSNLIPGWMVLIKILGISEEDGAALILGTLISLAVAAVAVVLLILSWQKVAGWML